MKTYTIQQIRDMSLAKRDEALRSLFKNFKEVNPDYVSTTEVNVSFFSKIFSSNLIVDDDGHYFQLERQTIKTADWKYDNDQEAINLLETYVKNVAHTEFPTQSKLIGSKQDLYNLLESAFLFLRIMAPAKCHEVIKEIFANLNESVFKNTKTNFHKWHMDIILKHFELPQMENKSHTLKLKVPGYKKEVQLQVQSWSGAVEIFLLGNENITGNFIQRCPSNGIPGLSTLLQLYRYHADEVSGLSLSSGFGAIVKTAMDTVITVLREMNKVPMNLNSDDEKYFHLLFGITTAQRFSAEQQENPLRHYSGGAFAAPSNNVSQSPHENFYPVLEDQSNNKLKH